MRHLGYVAGTGLSVAVLDVVDMSTSDVANQLTLLVLLVGAGLLGFAWPARAWLAGLTLGSALAVTHALYLAARQPLPYQMNPSGWAGPITLLVLLIPAFVAAFSGAGLAALGRRVSSDSGESPTRR
ncbi:MAG TPA: hypothetical protein VFP34_02780 [Microlunatus sp.]|nr:hypothetical protein [Microlunatus sp.]